MGSLGGLCLLHSQAHAQTHKARFQDEHLVTIHCLSQSSDALTQRSNNHLNSGTPDSTPFHPYLASISFIFMLLLVSRASCRRLSGETLEPPIERAGIPAVPSDINTTATVAMQLSERCASRALRRRADGRICLAPAASLARESPTPTASHWSPHPGFARARRWPSRAP